MSVIVDRADSINLGKNFRTDVRRARTWPACAAGDDEKHRQPLGSGLHRRRELLRSCGPLNVRRILFVFLADVFHDFFTGLKSRGERQLEWLGICAWIVD